MESSKKTVVVVDDDSRFLRSAVALLEGLGYKTEQYASAEAFLSVPQPVSDCCLMIDIQLNGMSGLELGQRLQRDGSGLPIIFMTGNKEGARKALLQGGYLACLTKPFSAQALSDALDKAFA